MIDVKKLVSLWQSGVETSDIAKELGITIDSVLWRARRLRKMGVPLKLRTAGRTRHISADLLEELKAMCQ